MRVLDYATIQTPTTPDTPESSMVRRVLKALKQAVPGLHTQLPKVNIELSHHYGIERFWECGMAAVHLRDAKLLILSQRQYHPEHLHRHHGERYLVLYGKVYVICDNKVTRLETGEKFDIGIGQRHSMFSPGGVVIRETFTSEIPGDSIYTDPAISPAMERKTLVLGVELLR